MHLLLELLVVWVVLSVPVALVVAFWLNRCLREGSDEHGTL